MEEALSTCYLSYLWLFLAIYSRDGGRHLLRSTGFTSRGLNDVIEWKFSSVAYSKANLGNLGVLSHGSKVNALSRYDLVLVKEENGRNCHLMGFLYFVS